jgi:hypothetical protein
MEGLTTALMGEATDIVLADGLYAPDPSRSVSGPVSLRGHRLWAEHLGAARLEFGVRVDEGPAGSELHGLSFEPPLNHHAAPYDEQGGTPAYYALVSGNASGANLHVEDCFFNGGGTLWGALRLDNPSGLQLARLEIANYRQSGVYLGRNTAELAPGESLTPTPLLSDLRVEHIGWGQAELPGDWALAEQWGLCLNDTAQLRRVRLRDIAYTGIVLRGRTQNAELSSLDIDGVEGVENPGGWAGAAAISLDQESHDVNLHHFCIGPNTRIGINGEWYQEPLPALHAVRPVVHDGIISSRRFGVHFDAGSVAAAVHDLTLEGYGRAGIVFFQNLVNEDDLDTTPIDPDDPDSPNPAALWQEYASEQWANVFLPECESAPELSYGHWNSHELCPGS